MAQYATDFLKGLPPRLRVEYQRHIKAGGAYLERAADGSQLMIIMDPARLDEAIFARPADGTDPVCIGNRAR